MMADTPFENNPTSKRGRGRPRGVRGVSRTTQPRNNVKRKAGTTQKRGRGRGRGGAVSIEDLISEKNETFEQTRPLSPDIDLEINSPMSRQSSREPSPTPSLASILSDRRLGSLSHDFPTPGRLASVKTASTGRHFLPTSSSITLRGTQKKLFVPTAPKADRRPQLTKTADAITPELFNIKNNEPFISNSDSSRQGINRGRGTRGYSRFMPDLVASGPFAFGSNEQLDTTNAFSTSIIEKIKSRTDYADFYSFREDPWTPDMLLVEHGKDLLEGKEVTYNEKSKEIQKKIMRFDEDENRLLCFQLPINLPQFEPSKCSRMSGLNDMSSHIDKGKGRATDKLEPKTLLTQSPVRKEKDDEREQDNAIRSNNKLEGQIGRLIMRRSGKMQMILGDFTFDVMPGFDRTFLENAMVIDPFQESAFNLGQVSEHLVVKPDISSLCNM